MTTSCYVQAIAAVTSNHTICINIYSKGKGVNGFVLRTVIDHVLTIRIISLPIQLTKL